MYEDAKSKYEAAAKLVKTGISAQERYTEVQKAYFAREAALQGTRDELRTQLAALRRCAGAQDRPEAPG